MMTYANLSFMSFVDTLVDRSARPGLNSTASGSSPNASSNAVPSSAASGSIIAPPEKVISEDDYESVS